MMHGTHKIHRMAFRAAPNAVLNGFWVNPDILDRNMGTYDIRDRKEKYVQPQWQHLKGSYRSVRLRIRK